MRFIAIFLIALLLNIAFGQQICLRRECPEELKGCDADCAALMGSCTFSCSLSSLGCLEKCMEGHDNAVKLLQCSFNKCIMA